MTTYHPQRTLSFQAAQLDRLPIRLALLGIGIVVIVLYVVQTSALAARTFVIHDLEKDVRTLRQAQQSLDVQIAEARSLKSITARLAGKPFVSVDSVAFLSSPGTAVAQR